MAARVTFSEKVTGEARWMRVSGRLWLLQRGGARRELLLKTPALSCPRPRASRIIESKTSPERSGGLVRAEALDSGVRGNDVCTGFMHRKNNNVLSVHN